MFFLMFGFLLLEDHQGPVLSRKHFNADSLVERIDQQKRPVDVFRREFFPGSYGNSMGFEHGSGIGIVWETYHKLVPFSGVP